MTTTLVRSRRSRTTEAFWRTSSAGQVSRSQSGATGSTQAAPLNEGRPLLVPGPVLDDHIDTLQQRDVPEHVAPYRYDVGKLSWADRSHLRIDFHGDRRPIGRRPNRR